MPSHIPRPIKLITFEKLKLIWKFSRDKSAAGIDRITPEKFSKNLDTKLLDIINKISNHSYEFSKLRLSPIPKKNGKHRIICIPTVGDRLVQRLVLDILNEKNRFDIRCEHSFGSVSGDGGVHGAIKLTLQNRYKHQWVLKTDITSFFDNIDRQELIILARKKLKNSSLLPLIEGTINCEIKGSLANNKILQTNGIIKGKGLRQGMPLSPILSNLFLSPFDVAMKKNSIKLVRYVDDIIVFCNSYEECQSTQSIIEESLRSVKLMVPSLSEINSKTVIKDPSEAVEFLGVEIYLKNHNYFCRIPQGTIQNIFSEINHYSFYEYVLKQGYNYPKLVRYLDDKQKGYSAAFKETVNIKQFLQRFELKKLEIKNALLAEILGAECLEKLDSSKKAFLGLS